MVAGGAKTSPEADNDINLSGRQGVESASAFAARLNGAKLAISSAELGRRSGVSPQLISEYLLGRKVPAAANLFAIADALNVDPRWLLTGRGDVATQPAPSAPSTSDDVTLIPRFDLHQLEEYGRGEPKEHVALPLDWVLPVARSAAGLWICDVPGDGSLLCRDPEGGRLVDGKLYIVILDGRPSIRRIRFTKSGLELLGGSDESAPVTLAGEEADQLVVLARVLAEITLQPT